MEEGVDDLQTFMELDNNDFDRLKLRTKVIKLIQRLQKELYNDPIEERLEDTTEDQVEDVGTDEAENSLNGSSNYQGITLDSVSQAIPKRCTFLILAGRRYLLIREYPSMT